MKEQYVQFMQEYESMGHMTLVCQKDCGEQTGRTNYLCHHFVTNDSSTTTKLRVVLDGSASTTAGVTFNDTMLVGATLQDDIYDLLLRFRVHGIVIKADIAKMFRQFLLRPDQCDLHRILWREDVTQPVKDYNLNTITYGTACAPNLATRCIVQLANDCTNEFPLAAKVLANDTFVDDILSGVSSVTEAIKLVNQLRGAVHTAGLELRKWTSNSKDVLATIPEELREAGAVNFDEGELVKALGVQWQPCSDIFKFKLFSLESSKSMTKWKLLSDLAKVFDPLGLISCVTLKGKLLLQELWKLPVGWDDKVPNNIQGRWEDYVSDIGHLKDLCIPRRITVDGAVKLELHGFADSSEAGFGAILYLRSITSTGEISVHFITSKTRVTPVRQVTLPRLELCAAVLLAELTDHVRECLKLDVDIYLWSDSTIVLKWIAGSPRRWKTYIANRVAKIQELTSISWWRHVAGIENPADLASRGTTVRELCETQFWWKGPIWLSHSQLPQFPVLKEVTQDLEERQSEVIVNSVEISEHPILKRFSCLNKLNRITAWYFRYLRAKFLGRTFTGQPNANELHCAMLFWIHKVQQQQFDEDYKQLSRSGRVGVKSKLKTLFPFIDGHDMLRVSGRLNHADLTERRKHQIILPGNSFLTELLIANFHHQNLHSGFQLTWSLLQSEYWIIRGRDKVRHYVRSCVVCRRYRAKAAEQLMGDLPASRVTPSRAFTHTGVDYAGPFIIKDVVGRVPKTYKEYLCLFVCLATKAVHLEGSISLSSEAFIGAFRRFVARRGLCAHIYSDCGTNFVGAERELKEFVQSASWSETVSRELGRRGITWHFNPPAAPHQGGLWEAAVKSAKFHLRRVLGSSTLTFEHFITMITQVEGVLNSRPLYALSSDPSDLETLTPGHFLIGGRLTAVPDADWSSTPINRLSHFQRLQQQLQQFWKRWSLEYLNTLQQRNKWMWDKQNMQVGDLVLMIEDTPPGTWKMARIVGVNPGADGRVRVVSLKTATTTLQRPIAKLVPLIEE